MKDDYLHYGLRSGVVISNTRKSMNLWSKTQNIIAEAKIVISFYILMTS